MQAAGIQENPSGKRDRRSSDRGEPSLREVGLYPLYLLGEKCPLCFSISGGRPCSCVGKNPEQGIYQEAGGK